MCVYVYIFTYMTPHQKRSSSLLRLLKPESLYQSAPTSETSHRGTSLIRNSAPQDPTLRLCIGPCGGPRGGGCFL